jgi:hypothetical protein
VDGDIEGGCDERGHIEEEGLKWQWT